VPADPSFHEKQEREKSRLRHNFAVYRFFPYEAEYVPYGKKTTKNNKKVIQFLADGFENPNKKAYRIGRQMRSRLISLKHISENAYIRKNV